jgi:squalene-hopene/tetraprenyl-beta-curcumene cyclase
MPAWGQIVKPSGALVCLGATDINAFFFLDRSEAMSSYPTVYYRLAPGILAVAVVASLAAPCSAQAQAPATDSPAATASADEISDRAIQYLRDRGQSADGSFSSHAGPGVTALVVTALIRNGVPLDDPIVARGLDYLLKFAQDDGSICQIDSLYRNYETCLAVMCLAEANRNGQYDEIIAKARDFLGTSQWDEGEGVESADTRYGGFGYGKHSRPDLSNTSFTIEALKAAGAQADSEAIQRAIVFVSRSQNLESPHNDTPHAGKINDGGFYYTPAGEGESQAETTANGGLRSYGSMTYAGLKSLLYAGVKPDDPRVQAATKWIRSHYALDVNPGMGASGLYYYYHVFAKALDAIGEDRFTDEQGVEHDWRAELTAELARRQQADGSWINTDSDRWLEGDPNLVTGYALLALSYCRQND